MTNYFNKYLKYKKKYLLGAALKPRHALEECSTCNFEFPLIINNMEELKHLCKQLEDSNLMRVSPRADCGLNTGNNVVSILTFNIGPQTYFKSLSDYPLSATHVNPARGEFFRPTKEENKGRDWPANFDDVEKLFANLPSPEDFLTEELFKARDLPHLCCFQEWQSQPIEGIRSNNLAFRLEDGSYIPYKASMVKRMRICPKCIMVQDIPILLVNIHGIIPFNNSAAKNDKIEDLYKEIIGTHKRSPNLILCGDFNINLEEMFSDHNDLNRDDPHLYRRLKPYFQYIRRHFIIFKNDTYETSNISRLIPEEILEQLTPAQRRKIFRRNSKFDFILISHDTIPHLDLDRSCLELFPKTLCTLENYQQKKNERIYLDCDHMPLCAHLHFRDPNPRLVDTPNFEELTSKSPPPEMSCREVTCRQSPPPEMSCREVTCRQIPHTETRLGRTRSFRRSLSNDSNKSQVFKTVKPVKKQEINDIILTLINIDNILSNSDRYKITVKKNSTIENLIEQAEKLIGKPITLWSSFDIEQALPYESGLLEDNYLDSDIIYYKKK